MLGTQSPSSPAPGILMEGFDQARQHSRRKRKAESQDNERLSKRLSLLNIANGSLPNPEQTGSKLYVPVETPSADAASSSKHPKAPPAQGGDEAMQLDDSKHRVYIYDLDAELSSDSDSDGDEGRLVFLPDIEKHLSENRIPRHILANDQGELAGMQLVLYSDPKSLSVPEEQDGVRRAIIEARQRARARQRKPDGGDHAGEMRSRATGSEAAAGTHLLSMGDACDAMEVD
ncbi:hypothetical protein Trco_002630 [Trichoderma cornu-damae]|uniref:Uncharacterized protein n=1 Tax=Trichoderma cornu-damae TaxID=654480 RepID=A0A9P8QQ73_9HYPO|nr:hypothetical protein Trco_002630 [Trichoderma cornu-damae]